MIAERAADLIRKVNTVKDIRIPEEILEKTRGKNQSARTQQ